MQTPMGTHKERSPSRRLPLSRFAVHARAALYYQMGAGGGSELAVHARAVLYSQGVVAFQASIQLVFSRRLEFM